MSASARNCVEIITGIVENKKKYFKDSPGHNILALCDFLEPVLFATNETELDI